MSTYPSNIPVFPTLTDEVDVVAANDENSARNEIIALCTYIGTNPQGSKSSFADRVNVLLNGSGVLNNSNGFPTDTTPVRLFYRTDSETLFIRRFDNSAWQSIGGAPSNVLFQYAALVGSEITDVNNSIGEIIASSYTPLGGTNPQANLRFIRKLGSANSPVFAFRLKKISGISTVNFHCQLWGSGSPKCSVNIGGVIGTAIGVAVSQPSYFFSNSMDISALGNGTYYDIIVNLSDNAGSATVFMGNLIGFGS